MRDRLADLIASCKNESGEDPLGVEQESFMEGFFRKVEETRGLVDRISSQVEEVKNKHSCILAAPDPDERTKKVLAWLNDEIKRSANAVRDSLKAMQEDLPQDESTIRASANLRIQKSQHSMLSLRFGEVMTLYNEAQVSFRERSKGRIRRQLEITGRVTTSEQLEDMLESGNPAIFTSDVFSDSLVTREALNEIESRREDIVRLEASIRELHQMFVDMAALVENQGDVTNNIEKNVCSAAEYIGRAERETKKAVRYQSKGRRVRLLPSIPSLFKSGETGS